MKKKILALTMTLVLALNFSACGKSTSESGKNSGADAFGDRVADNKDSEDDENENALIAWYESEDRKSLEDFINNTVAGHKFFIEVEEPDIIVYKYQYTEQRQVTDLFLEKLERGVDKGSAATKTDLWNYRNTYGIDLYAIRIVFLNADGSFIYEQEITEDYEPSESDGDSASLGEYADLQDWMDSDEAAQLVEMANNMLASSGMTVDITAENNTFVYEYYFSEEFYEETGMANYSGEQLQAAIERMVESQRVSLESIFTDFEENYGLTLDAVRVVFYQEDGTFIGSTDLLNENIY